LEIEEVDEVDMIMEDPLVAVSNTRSHIEKNLIPVSKKMVDLLFSENSHKFSGTTRNSPHDYG
jgi:hypothetical protein